ERITRARVAALLAGIPRENPGGASPADLDLADAGRALRQLGHLDVEDAVLEGGRDLLRVHPGRQTHDPLERAVHALVAIEALLLALLLELLLALEDVLIAVGRQGEVDVLLAQAGQLGRDAH